MPVSSSPAGWIPQDHKKVNNLTIVSCDCKGTCEYAEGRTWSRQLIQCPIQTLVIGRTAEVALVQTANSPILLSWDLIVTKLHLASLSMVRLHSAPLDRGPFLVPWSVSSGPLWRQVWLPLPDKLAARATITQPGNGQWEHFLKRWLYTGHH